MRFMAMVVALATVVTLSGCPAMQMPVAQRPVGIGGGGGGAGIGLGTGGWQVGRPIPRRPSPSPTPSTPSPTTTPRRSQPRVTPRGRR